VHVDRDVPLLHALEQAGLRLGRGAVDLVDQHDVGEHRPGPELEAVLALVEDVGAHDIGWKQVGRALDACVLGVDGSGQRARQRCLPHAGVVLDQHVPLGQQRDQDVAHRVVGCLDRARQVGPQAGAELLDGGRIELGQDCHEPHHGRGSDQSPDASRQASGQMPFLGTGDWRLAAGD
jgi:hypothetical protein